MNEVAVDDIKRVVRERGLTKMPMGTCSMCGYPLAFVFLADAVGFDPGCYCVAYPPGIEPRSWDSVANHFNIQDPEVRARLWNEFSGAPGQQPNEPSEVTIRKDRDEWER